MEQKMYYHNTKSFRHFISWRQRYRLGRYKYSIYSIIVIIIIIINYTSASNYSEKLLFNNYNVKINSNNNRIGSGSEHSRRHSHKYPPQDDIDSFLSSLQNSKNIFQNVDKESPNKPYDVEVSDSEVCPMCNLGRETATRNADEIRLEAIKRQILSKLGLKQKPTITLPVPRDVILETLSRAGDYPTGGSLLAAGRDDGRKATEDSTESEEEFIESEPDDFYGRTSEIITFAEPGRLLNGQTLLEFSHSSESDPGVLISQLRVKSALLWVRVALNNRSVSSFQLANKNLTLWVFKVKTSLVNASFLSGKDFDEFTELVGSLSVSLSNVGWQKIDMTATVKEWYKESSQQKEKLRLLVDCSGCKDIVQVLIFPRSRGVSRPQQQQQQQQQSGASGKGRKVRSIMNGNESQRQSDKQILHGSNKIKLEMKYGGGDEGGGSGSGAGGGGGGEEYVRNESSQLDPNRPFLVVHTEPVVMKRSRRRAMDCSGAVKGQCCKQNFFVSFKDLKWDDWIIAPKGYHANYCRGDCGGIHRTPDTYSNYHTHVIEEYRKMDRISGIQPCCAPVKFSSMSLIYFGPDNNIIKRDLPKMVVEQCGCP